MNLKQVGIGALLLVAAFSAGRFSTPKQVEIKEVEKIVSNEKESKDETKDFRIETKETTLPDGTKIKETVREKKKDTHLDASRETSTEKESLTKISNQSQWSVGVYTNKEVISATIDRRIFGGIFLGVYGRMNIPYSNLEYGAGLRLEF